MQEAMWSYVEFYPIFSQGYEGRCNKESCDCQEKRQMVIF